LLPEDGSQRVFRLGRVDLSKLWFFRSVCEHAVFASMQRSRCNVTIGEEGRKLVAGILRARNRLAGNESNQIRVRHKPADGPSNQHQLLARADEVIEYHDFVAVHESGCGTTCRRWSGS
jgi:hypothetical protein